MRFSLAAALFFCYVLPAPAVWEIAGPYGGTATSLAIDPRQPRVLLAGARGPNVFKSEDGGRHWRPLNLPVRFGGAVTALVIDPLDSRHYLAGTHDTGSPFAGLYESRDAGVTWHDIPDLRGVPIWALAVHPNQQRRMAAATRRGVWLSDDSGATWRRITHADHVELSSVTAVAFDPRRTETLYAGTTHLPWKTTDGGRTWNSIHTGLIDDSDVFSIFIHPERPDLVFASACCGIYRSADAGANWKKFAGIPGTLRRTHVILQDPAEAKVLYAGTTLGLLRSTDAGATWKQLNNYSTNAIVIDPSDTRRLYFATDSYGVLLSEDRGETLEPRIYGFAQSRVTDLTQAGDRIYVAAQLDPGRGGIYESSTPGAAWKLAADSTATLGVSVQSLAGHPARKGLLYAAGASTMLKSVDGGKTWISLAIPARNAPQIHDLHLLMMPKDHAVVLAATSAGLWRSVDGGVTWAESALGRYRGVGVYAIVGTSSGRVLAARSPAGIFISADYGIHWLALDAPFDSTRIFDVALTEDPGDPIFCATSAGLYRFYSGQWTPVAGPLVGATVSAVRSR